MRRVRQRRKEEANILIIELQLTIIDRSGESKEKLPGLLRGGGRGRRHGTRQFGLSPPLLSTLSLRGRRRLRLSRLPSRRE